MHAYILTILLNFVQGGALNRVMMENRPIQTNLQSAEICLNCTGRWSPRCSGTADWWMSQGNRGGLTTSSTKWETASRQWSNLISSEPLLSTTCAKNIWNTIQKMCMESFINRLARVHPPSNRSGVPFTRTLQPLLTVNV